MNTITRSLTLAGILFFAFSCKKDEAKPTTSNEDRTSPAVTIAKPLDHSTYHTGDTLPIHVQVTDNDQLHEVAVTVYNETTQKNVWELEEHAHGSFSLDTGVVIQDTVDSDYELVVRANDHQNNITRRTLKVHVKR